MSKWSDKLNHEQNIRDGLTAKAPPPKPREPRPGCDSIVANAIGVFMVVIGLAFLVIGSL